jgi:diacylglycerol diphosphate phosphatase/phosphatidate phosphatase
MSHNGSGNAPTPILQRVGLTGAAARFAQHSYGADYIALAFLVIGWVLVSYDICSRLIGYFFNNSTDSTVREPISSHVFSR